MCMYLLQYVAATLRVYNMWVIECVLAWSTSTMQHMGLYYICTIRYMSLSELTKVDRSL